MRSPALRRALLGVAAVLAAAVLGAAPKARAAGPLDQLERVFKTAIDKVLPATVVCLPIDAPPGLPGSSGVLVSRDGLVLSDADVGTTFVRNGQEWVPQRGNAVQVRVPDLRSGGFTAYDARVLRRVAEADTALLRITNPPRGGFPDYLRPASDADLRVGAFAFVAGNSFARSAEALPAVTAGVVSALERSPDGSNLLIHTSAAVNPGVNGGPMVDIAGRLVGTVSSAVPPEPTTPFQFLGRVIPMDRLRAVYADSPEASEVFVTTLEGTPTGLGTAREMEAAFHAAARAGRPGVVSIAVQRESDVAFRIGAGDKVHGVPRYQGPVSGVAVAPEGHVVTALYNLTNLAPLAERRWDPPPEETVSAGLAQIRALTVHLPSGEAVPYELASYHEGLNLAVLRPAQDATELQRAAAARAGATWTPVPADRFQPGRFALALGDPFGAERRDLPLLTVGILSKPHAPRSGDPWTDMWQTDAGATDGNAGGAVVDFEGRLYGMLSLWDPIRHGRNSGIGFVVPWARIAEVLPQMAAGRTFARPLMGISWDTTEADPKGADWSALPPRVLLVNEDSAAQAAGLEPGDLVVAVDGEPVASIGDCARLLESKWSGDPLRVRVRRDDGEVDLDLVLGRRP